MDYREKLLEAFSKGPRNDYAQRLQETMARGERTDYHKRLIDALGHLNGCDDNDE